MPPAELDSSSIESIIRRIVAFYIESAEEKDAEYLLRYLGGGMIPAPVVTVLQPILQSLTDPDTEFGSHLTRANFDALEQLRLETEALYMERAAARTLLKEAINSPQWMEAEQAQAARYRLKVLTAGERSLDLIAHEVALSIFTAEEVIAAFQNDPALVIEFSLRWHADCRGHDYGEEWDPDEGNQQEDTPPGKVLGMSQGFLVGTIIFYLYADRAPADLLPYLQVRKIPYSRKVVKDVLRVYRSTGGSARAASS